MQAANKGVRDQRLAERMRTTSYNVVRFERKLVEAGEMRPNKPGNKVGARTALDTAYTLIGFSAGTTVPSAPEAVRDFAHLPFRGFRGVSKHGFLLHEDGGDLELRGQARDLMGAMADMIRPAPKGRREELCEILARIIDAPERMLAALNDVAETWQKMGGGLRFEPRFLYHGDEPRAEIAFGVYLERDEPRSARIIGLGEAVFAARRDAMRRPAPAGRLVGGLTLDDLVVAANLHRPNDGGEHG
jgi:hypothetical protein